ncbi:MAG TPA: ATP-binding protein, partial [Ktedonobacterales bacterium]|nr:ATP-binding protein [Ktedonobacterales bacterium]
RLTQLTDDLLEVSRVQAGEITLHLEPLDLVALVKRVRTRLHTAAPHSIRVISASKYVVALVDRRRMEQVLMHLLTNAIKFSPAGGKIVVTLREDRASGLAELSVQDHGIGIPPDQQDQIFGRFVRATNAQQSGISGRGLGLYLCRELIQRHGGRLWFHSVEGQGSTFTLVVPLYGD